MSSLPHEFGKMLVVFGYYTMSNKVYIKLGLIMDLHYSCDTIKAFVVTLSKLWNFMSFLGGYDKGFYDIMISDLFINSFNIVIVILSFSITNLTYFIKYSLAQLYAISFYSFAPLLLLLFLLIIIRNSDKPRLILPCVLGANLVITDINVCCFNIKVGFM